MDDLKAKAARGVGVTHRLTVGQFLAEWIEAKTGRSARRAGCPGVQR